LLEWVFYTLPRAIASFPSMHWWIGPRLCCKALFSLKLASLAM
jgi:hypothetical protein